MVCDLTARCRDQTTGSKAQAANFFLIDTEQAERSSRLNVDLCDIARKLKVMRPWERLTLRVKSVGARSPCHGQAAYP